MIRSVTIQRFRQGTWIDVASVALEGDPGRGMATPTQAAYTLDYAIDHLDRRDAAALSWQLPVRLDAKRSPRWPAFLVDLLPQGYGRQELLRRLNLSLSARDEVQWPLLVAGAGNPIGHLRIKEAHEWLETASPAAALRGFLPEEIAARSDDFIEFLVEHGLFVAGSSGVQGEWPKILLTEAENGLLYLDHTLPDNQARRHWLVKFGFGQDPLLAKILTFEAAYMRVARRLGLRVHGDLKLIDRALFIPRFDRRVTATGVERIAQESLTSLCGIADVGVSPTHTEAVTELARAVTNPDAELLEYLKRDIVNVVMGNRDNHGRNTAIHRGTEREIALSPLFDFAPMFLHPDVLARNMRWPRDDMGAPRWASAIEQCREAAELPLSGLEASLRVFAVALAGLPQTLKEEGASEILGRQGGALADTLKQLEAL